MGDLLLCCCVACWFVGSLVVGGSLVADLEIWDLEFGIWNLETSFHLRPGVTNSEFQIPNSEF